MKRIYSLVVFCLLSGTAPVWGQVFAIDDAFEEENPCENGWKCIGNGNPATDIARWATWFSPDENPCDEGGNPDCANLFDPPEGYMRLTGPVGDARAVMWREELIRWDNFRLTAEVELRGGTNPPADGMTITIIADDDGEGYTNSDDEFPGAGQFAGGGGMSATGHGDYPTMIFEFDNWNNGASDINNNHVGFEYSPTGFPPTDVVPSDASAAVPVPLNGSGRFLFEVLVQRGTVACNLTNEAAGLPRTRMYTYDIPDFEPFDGYLGLTGSTGGSNQHHILHSIRVEQLRNPCLLLPFVAERGIDAARIDSRQSTPLNPDGIEVPVWQAGDVIDVTITLSDIRADSEECDPPTDVMLTETLPPGWAAVNISGGGNLDDVAGTITWNLGPAELTDGHELTYQMTAVDNTFRAQWSGVFADNEEFAEPGGVTGDTGIDKDSPFDPCGGIRLWNILGPYDQPGSNQPDEFTMQEDYMTDGEDDETSFVFSPDAEIETDFEEAFSNFLLPNANDQNPGDIPTVVGWSDLGSSINVNDDVYGGDPNNAMAYAQCYVINTTDAPIEAYVGVSADDAIAVIWNEDYYYLTTDGGLSDACSPQNVTNVRSDGAENDPVEIQPGQNSLIVKTFEGDGGFGFSLLFLDVENLEPLTEGLDISLTPGAAPEGSVLLPGDVNFDGSLNISDPVAGLGFLFSGQVLNECYATEEGGAVVLTDTGTAVLDWTGDGSHNITDAVASLDFQFGGGVPHTLGGDCVTIAGSSCEEICP